MRRASLAVWVLVAWAILAAPALAGPACAGIDSYYWEIGDRNGALYSGSVVGRRRFDANSPMSIASASKWLYGAYVAQTAPLPLTANDIEFLTMTSGYHTFSTCAQRQTVARCSAAGSNGVFTPSDVGTFYYAGSHFQKQAAAGPLGPMKNPELGAAMSNALGITVSYDQPQLAGGAVMTPAAYAVFLRRVMRGELAIAGLLGTNAVCTNPATCPTALYSPVTEESWHYSLGHWVETEGDGAFSSPGVFGFYPWISADRTRYGIVAREAINGSWGSVQCGRELRATYR